MDKFKWYYGKALLIVTALMPISSCISIVMHPEDWLITSILGLYTLYMHLYVKRVLRSCYGDGYVKLFGGEL